jgi:hypothetical protein
LELHVLPSQLPEERRQLIVPGVPRVQGDPTSSPEEAADSDGLGLERMKNALDGEESHT